jgi:hypothetical protein
VASACSRAGSRTPRAAHSMITVAKVSAFGSARSRLNSRRASSNALLMAAVATESKGVARNNRSKAFGRIASRDEGAPSDGRRDCSDTEPPPRCVRPRAGGRSGTAHEPNSRRWPQVPGIGNGADGDAWKPTARSEACLSGLRLCRRGTALACHLPLRIEHAGQVHQPCQRGALPS